MATLQDLDLKRVELNSAINDYKQAVVDFRNATNTQGDVDAAKALAVTKGDEYAKLISQVKQDDPNVTNDDQLFSRPAAMNALVRDDVATIVRTGRLFGDGMKLLIDTEGNAANATNVILSFATGSAIDVDWGDGSNIQAFTGAASHNYAIPGQYTVEVHGTVNGFTSPLVESRQQLKDVMQWGELEFANANLMFRSRTGFVISAADGPTFLPGCSCTTMFYGASDFNSNINHWDVSNVVDMASMFASTDAFNQPLNLWNVGNVVNMASMFYYASLFNQPLNSWNVSKVTNFASMFRDAAAFNQPLSPWVVSSAVDMRAMFMYASAFNQNLGPWNVSNVITLFRMFYKATVFNKNIAAWNVSSVTDTNSYNDFAYLSSLAGSNSPF
jgi:surface protein